MFTINVPAGVENETAYIAAANAHIKNNARKGRRSRWFAATEDAQRLSAWLNTSGEFHGYWVETRNGVQVRLTDDELGCDGCPNTQDAKYVNNPMVCGMFSNDFGQFLLTLRDNMNEFGALTEKQAQVVRDALARKEQWVADADKKRAAALEADRQSVFVGELKERRDWVLTIGKVLSFDGEWGTTYINLMKDEAGNVVIGKGTKSYGEAGTTVKVKATVVKHDTRDGVQQTFVNRPKFEEVV
jgi:hypothetical protein